MDLHSALRIDPAQTCDDICAKIQEFLRDVRRRGAVLGISGGVDSAVVAALCVRALGKDRVLGLYMPEADSSHDSLRLGRVLAEQLGIATEFEDITAILEAAGCYRRRDAAIRSVIPAYTESYKSKIVLPNLLDTGVYQLFSVIVESPEGVETKTRLPLEAYLAIVAATNFKQRTRKMMEYYHADRLNYAVAGTPNRLEYDQGFFVKNGDGAADFKPIAHLFKSQIYQLAEYLEVPEEIRLRPPTTDTYSLQQSQEEFYFALPYDKMDLAIYARDENVSAADLAKGLGVTTEVAEKVYSIIDAKRKAARYLHLPPKKMTAE
jgi:NAD+ synthase